jgi:uncharacterized protein (DUF924 family)
MEWQDVIRFWFEECKPAQWFTKDEAFDQTLRDRFASVHAAAVKGETASWRSEPRGKLAEIIVLDQFPRNMFRGTREAFASDEHALRLAEEAVAAGDDQKLSAQERHFLYMPYMHSESPEIHEKALQLFTALGKAEALDYEIAHKKIIDRFGRYPHRNAILGRASTPEEIEFMETHKGF